MSIVSTPHAGRQEGASDRPEFEAIRLKKPCLLQSIAIMRLTEVSLGRTDTCMTLALARSERLLSSNK